MHHSPFAYFLLTELTDITFFNGDFVCLLVLDSVPLDDHVLGEEKIPEHLTPSPVMLYPLTGGFEKVTDGLHRSLRWKESQCLDGIDILGILVEEGNCSRQVGH